MKKTLILLALALTALSFGSEDVVKDALHYTNQRAPVTKSAAFDQVLAGLRVRKWTAAQTTHPVLFDELSRVAKLDAAGVADVQRLWKSYMTVAGDFGGGRAPRSPGLLPEDVLPQMADKWMYLLLKPDWQSNVNGSRDKCVLALIRCDEERTLRVLPELIDFLYGPDSGFAAESSFLYSLFCMAYSYPDARGLAVMTSIQDAVSKHPEMTFFSGTFEKTFSMFLSFPNRTEGPAWRQLLQGELRKPALGAKMRKSIGEILGGGA